MGVIAMNRTALIAVAVVLSLTSCATPEPPDTARAEDRRSEPAPQPPELWLVAKAIQQAEAAIEVAENAQWYLAQRRGARRPMFIARLEFRLALDAAKAAHDSAPEATTSSYEASVAAFEGRSRRTTGSSSIQPPTSRGTRPRGNNATLRSKPRSRHGGDSATHRLKANSPNRSHKSTRFPRNSLALGK